MGYYTAGDYYMAGGWFKKLKKGVTRVADLATHTTVGKLITGRCSDRPGRASSGPSQARATPSPSPGPSTTSACARFASAAPPVVAGGTDGLLHRR